MRRTTKMYVLAGALMLSQVAFAQGDRESPNGFYKLDFVAREMDDNKVVSTTTYTMTASEKYPGSIRTGSRVPTPTRPGEANFTYIDLGVSFDCRDVREVGGGQLSLTVSVDISTAASDSGLPGGGPPVIRQFKWSSSALVPMRKATQIYSSDALGSKRKFQIELTATPLK